MSEKEYQNNRTRLIHAANTARLTGINRDITLYLPGYEEQAEGEGSRERKLNVNEEEGEGRGEGEGSRERGRNEFNDDNNNNNIMQSNNEGERDDNENDNDNDAPIEHFKNENVDKESSSDNLLKGKLRMSSSFPFPSSLTSTSTSLSSSRRFDLSKAYNNLLCDQNNLRRSQGTFLRNIPPWKETFRRSKSCPKKVENEKKFKNEYDNEYENDYESENENVGRRGKQNYRHDDDDDRNDYNRTARSIERECEGSGRRHRSEERSSERGRGRESLLLPGHENDYRNDNESRRVEVAVAIKSMKRGRATEPSKRAHVPCVEHKQHVQYVRPASSSASKESRRKTTTWLSTSNSQPAPHTPHYTGNHYPLRTSTSTSTRLLSGQYPMNLNARNALSIPYIMPENQPFHQNTLTSAVEKVVTDFFR